MATQPEETRHEIVYRADPFALIFRELELIRYDIRDIKSEITFLHKRIDETNKRIDEFSLAINQRIDETNKRIDEVSNELNRRLDKLFVVVILNLLAVLGFLLKLILSSVLK